MGQDSDLLFYERQLRDAENDLADIALRVELSRSIAELHQHPGWKGLVDRLRSIQENEVERLMTANMSPYDLGRRQGRIVTLRLLTAQEPLTEEQVANLRERATLLQEQVTVYRNLLN